MVDNRVTFGSKLGVILATVGCAVGLGSIWRFPYMLGTNGGAAFLLIYILFMIFLGIPVMVTEFFIGRYSRSNTVGSFKKMAPGTKWCWIGYNGILAAFLILGFYAVVSGWTLEYVWQTVNGNLYSTPGVDFTAGFDNFSSNALRPIFWTAVFIGLTHFVIASGVEKGIERASKIMLPLGGMLTCIFVGTRVDKKILKAELTNEGTIKFRLFSIYVFFMKYVSPIAIGIVFLNELGLLDQLKKLF